MKQIRNRFGLIPVIFSSITKSIIVSVILLFTILKYHCFASNHTPLKIVYELPNHNVDNNIDSNTFFESITKPKVKLTPANFSGPDHLKELKGLCFSYLNQKYNFKVCPFDNVTQEEVQALQMPYKGILGVWGEWIVENNTFVALHFIEGNKCGAGIQRSTKIYLKCGAVNRILNMMEPSRCYYNGTFETPLVCGRNSLVVYPRLPQDLQREWDKIETERYYEILTQQGYEENLINIFIKANYMLPLKMKKTLNSQILDEETKSDCESEKEALAQRVKELEEKVKIKEAILKSLMKDIHEKETNGLQKIP